MSSIYSSIPTESEWLEKRENEWAGYEENTFFTGNTPKKEVMAYSEYFLNGDIKAFTDKTIPHMASLIYLSPVQSLDDLKLVIESSLRWSLANAENPEWRMRNHGYNGDWDTFLMSVVENCYIANSQFSSDYRLWLDMFKWIYGTKYDPTRVVELVAGEPHSRIHVKFNIAKTCNVLSRGIKGYLFYENERETGERFKHLVDYFLSLYPHCNPVFFSKQLPSSSKVKIEGVTYRKGAYIQQRSFLAAINNILTPYDEADGRTELVPSDPDLLDKLRKGLKQPTMPPEYYELEKFVISKGYDCLSASE